jgi:hypothetical protein
MGLLTETQAPPAGRCKSRCLQRNGNAGEASHIRLNSDNDPVHRARLYDLACADHFARLLDDVQMGISDLKQFKKRSGKTFDLITF